MPRRKNKDAEEFRKELLNLIKLYAPICGNDLCKKLLLKKHNLPIDNDKLPPNLKYNEFTNMNNRVSDHLKILNLENKVSFRQATEAESSGHEGIPKKMWSLK